MIELPPPPASRQFRYPTESEKRRLYEFYKLIFLSDFTDSKKRSLMTSALGFETWSWRVLFITDEAIRAIAGKKFNKPTGKLARDHHKPRAETCRTIFAREKKMEFEEWWTYVWENDWTVLMTNEEHRAIRTQPPSKKYHVNPEDSLFVDAPTAGWYQTQAREGEFVKWLCKEHSITY